MARPQDGLFSGRFPVSLMAYSPKCLEKLSEKGYEHCFERGFRSCTEAKKREKHLLGGPQSHAVDASGAFRTVSEGVFSEVRIAPVRYL